MQILGVGKALPQAPPPSRGRLGGGDLTRPSALEARSGERPVRQSPKPAGGQLAFIRPPHPTLPRAGGRAPADGPLPPTWECAPRVSAAGLVRAHRQRE